MSSAKISIWGKTIGLIAWDEPNRTAVFDPDPSYVQGALNIAPYIHQNKEDMLYGNDFNDFFKGLIPTFNDSLPDSFGNGVFKQWLEQMGMDQSEMNPVERLLYVGNRGIGAIEYHKGKDIPNITHNIDLGELAHISDKIIKRKYNQEDYLHNPQALQNILTIGSSIGGAQAKILVAMTTDEKLLAGDIIHHDPVDYYIVKLEHDPKDIWYREKNYVEYVYNQLAADIGINVAPSRLIEEGGRAHFASQRFDRVNNKKVHKQTVNAFTGFYGKNTQFSYENIFKIIEFLKLPHPNAEQLFMQMVFNVAASNRDDHTKNFSFIMSEQGVWSLSPAYDLTYPSDPHKSYQVPHQISINNNVKNITRADLEAVAKKVGIRNQKSIIDNVLDHVSTFEQRIQQYNLNKNTIQLIVKDIAKNIDRLK